MLTNALTGQPITSTELASIATLCKKQLELENSIAIEEQKLASQKDQLKQISEKVAITKYYSAGITAEKQEDALNWLRANDHSDIIKNKVEVQFGKGEDDIAELTVQLLQQKGLSPEQKTFVHPMTLKSFVKEQVESGANFPQDLFGVFVGNKTKITQPKK